MGALTWLIPAEAGIAIILWIGVIITAQAFEVTPARHFPAVVVGLFPGLAAWTMLIVKTSLTAAGVGSPGGPVLDTPLVRAAHAAGAYIGGGFALEQGFLYSAMIWAAIVVCIVDRQWTRAAVWSGIGALLGAQRPDAFVCAHRTRHRHQFAAAGLAERPLDAGTLLLSRG